MHRIRHGVVYTLGYSVGRKEISLDVVISYPLRKMQSSLQWAAVSTVSEERRVPPQKNFRETTSPLLSSSLKFMYEINIIQNFGTKWFIYGYSIQHDSIALQTYVLQHIILILY